MTGLGHPTRRNSGPDQTTPDPIWLLTNLAFSYLAMAAERDEARRAHRELLYRCQRDQLTGLPNRELLFDRLGQALSGAHRYQHTVALFFIDLNGFKQINDTFGHAVGDTVLKTAASRMAATLRLPETLARFGGDEFVVLCADLPQLSEAELARRLDAVAGRIRQALSPPIRVAGTTVTISASVGVATSKGATSAHDLLAAADAAMYRAKRGGQRPSPATDDIAVLSPLEVSASLELTAPLEVTAPLCGAGDAR